ncbi:MAG TPA: metallophosphoesterase [Pseudonocardiaceae bacterium]|nr:metallophosphoesterase [Pseudonocardiaceae bacterium]
MNPPELTLIQFSDTHICPDGELLHGSVDTFGALERAIDRVLAAGIRVHGLLLTGDLADDGKPEAYRRLAALLRPAAERLGASVVYAMGNHDERTAFAAELLDTPLDTPPSGPLDSVHLIGGVRVIALDSTIPGRPDGRLVPEQLAWLRAELARPAPRGTILVLHHPPLPSPVAPVHLLRLRDAEELAAALAASDVRLVLTGHAHHTGCGALAGIPVWVSPALAYRLDPLPPPGRMRGVGGAGFSRIDLIDGTFVATAVAVGAADPVYDLDAEDTARQILELTKDG